jgi:UDP-N-acetyl-alpha-D-muramoyl-L-alanyl-L-glutamate epimerase
LAAIEGPAATAGLPLVRADRYLDPQVLRSEELGFLNGHVPVTGIYSAVAVWAAAASGRNHVVMSNEWSASSGNVSVRGRPVNHQYSKSLDFEDRFRAWLAATVDAVQYFSYLRARSELWVAQRFARLPAYHPIFRSCNRAFHIDPGARLDQWCGRCDKCCFIDLVLAPFLAPGDLSTIFGGREPLSDPELVERFRTLLGLSEVPKPWECVGEPGECRAAAVLAAARADRAASGILAGLAAEAAPLLDRDPRSYLEPMGADHVPDALQAQDLLV